MSGSLATVAVERIVAGAWEQNCFVVASTGGDAVVVDPGGRAEAIAELVARQDLRVLALLATHGHYDHVGALAELADRYGAPFCIHSADAGALARVNFHRYALHKQGPIAIPPIDVDLAEQSVLSFGELTIAVVHTPGHSPGSVCFEVGGMLFVGDALMAAESVKLPGYDAAALAASLRALGDAFPPETVVHPGHGETGTLESWTTR